MSRMQEHMSVNYFFVVYKPFTLYSCWSHEVLKINPVKCFNTTRSISEAPTYDIIQRINNY
ncbi:hypothetical protein MNBD_GAMMA11-830 [hydrothermal vent metagenome]|uniref:Uncharacterized protein n=1 Tax=hydrothermal vent metagenome TaxID=652676 RepID=A0A3B0WTB5_9ZZZZ